MNHIADGGGGKPSTWLISSGADGFENICQIFKNVKSGFIQKETFKWVILFLLWRKICPEVSGLLGVS
jgi:hypothetical protein